MREREERRADPELARDLAEALRGAGLERRDRPRFSGEPLGGGMFRLCYPGGEMVVGPL